MTLLSFEHETSEKKLKNILLKTYKNAGVIMNKLTSGGRDSSK